jgi:hypothetical protein
MLSSSQPRRRTTPGRRNVRIKGMALALLLAGAAAAQEQKARSALSSSAAIAQSRWTIENSEE